MHQCHQDSWLTLVTHYHINLHHCYIVSMPGNQMIQNWLLLPCSMSSLWSSSSLLIALLLPSSCSYWLVLPFQEYNFNRDWTATSITHLWHMLMLEWCSLIVDQMLCDIHWYLFFLPSQSKCPFWIQLSDLPCLLTVFICLNHVHFFYDSDWLHYSIWYVLVCGKSFDHPLAWW